MNAGVRRIFVVVLVMFGVLLAATVRWTVVEADSLNANERNKREILATARIPRGTIRAADGTLLARSVKLADGTYTRRYTDAAASAGQLVGYAYTNPGTSGIEKAYQDELTGKVTNAATLLSSLRGGEEQGNDVVATLDPKVQQAGLAGIGDRTGAAVAIDTETGGILAMVSTPTLDPNLMGRAASAAALQRRGSGPLLNRATRGLYPPGSTFKVVTAAAALGSGRYTPDSTIDGSSPMIVQTKELRNFNNAQYPADTTLTTALTNSVNTVFARIAEDLGPGPIADQMDDFGFGELLPIDLPEDQLARSGVRDLQRGRMLDVNADVDVARVAIGQERLLVTPLQMAYVAATIARGGVKPRMTTVDRVLDPDGRVVDRVTRRGRSAGRAMSRRDAAELSAMMQNVVREGTGTEANLRGLQVAGKTGSAETDVTRNLTDPWFIGFAPAKDPKVAVAVVLEDIQGGQGGIDAAPIARAMMQAAL